MKRWAGFFVAVVSVGGLAYQRAAGAPGGPPTYRKQVLAAGQVVNGTVVADLDGDGRPDIAAAGPEQVAWYRRDGDTWTEHVIARHTPTTGSVDSICLTPYDVDGDGRLDLIASTPASGDLVWYENPGDPSRPWTRHRITNLPRIHSQALGDVDGDGRPDLVANTEGMLVWYSIPPDARHAAEEPRGAAEIKGPVWQRHVLSRDGVTGTPHYLHFYDLHGAGKPVLCAGSPDGAYMAWWERPASGTGEWTRHPVRERFEGASHFLAADFNGDGKLDLFLSRGHAAGSAWLAGPDWTRETPIDSGTLKEPHALTVADVDGDGAPDVAAVGRFTGGVVVWRNNGKGEFTRVPVDADQRGMDIRAADLNGDGLTDLVVAGATSKNLVVYLRSK